MSSDLLFKVPLALLPALVLLIIFDRLDAFDLVNDWGLARAMLAGAVLSAMSYLVNGRSLDGLPIGFSDYSRYLAPFVEEALKAAFIVWMLWRNRIGFMVDAAIVGFALGVGFALFENAYYLWLVPGANIGVWLVRGFGTAVMHGGASALFAVIGHSLNVGRERPQAWRLIPGYLAAVALHGAYNQFPYQPVGAMVGVLVFTPFALLLAFARGSHAADRWLSADYAGHAHLLEELEGEGSGAAGRLLSTVRAQLSPAAAEDAAHYFRLHTGLIAAAEARFLAREAGEALASDPTLEARLEELHAVEKRLGHAALLALRPHLHVSRRELWEIHVLESEVSHPLRRRLSQRTKAST